MDFKPFSILLPLVALFAFLALHQLLFPLPMAFSLTIATFNCRGFTKPSKQAEVLELAKSKHVDILLLQETYIHSAAQIRNFDSSFKTRSLWSFGRTGSCGVAIVLMPHFEGSVLRHSRDSEGRTLWIDLDCGIRVVNVYAPLRPRSKQAEFFHTLDDILLGPSRVVVAGDFNVVLNTTDRSSNRGKRVARDYTGVKALRTLVDELELVDAWRALRPGQAGMTWTGRGSQSRLDRFYVSPSLAISMHSTWITPSALSDHHLAVLRFADPEWTPRERGTWRLNTRLLHDPEIVCDVEALIDNFLNTELEPTDWDELKDRIRECLRAWGKKRAREERAQLTIVSDAILLLSSPLSRGSGVAAALTELRREYRRLLRHRWDAMRALARAERWESEAWCARNILRRRLAHRAPALSLVINPENGQVASTPDAVLDAARLFYSDLYELQATTPELFPLVGPQEPVEVTDSPLTEGELFEALKKSKLSRSPGSDGLTPDFYLKFWGRLGKPFTTLANKMLSNGCLTVSQREGLITLLCKDEARRSDLRAWRPITLLNCDYKMIAKCIATRLTDVLDVILGPYQACCVPGRSAQMHGFGIRDLLEWAESRNLQGLLCSFDQEKAFDVVSHDYIFQILQQARIGSNVQKMVRALYCGPTSAVTIRGSVSESFSVGRGVRQGCPLSPVLYVLAIEPLLQRLASDSQIGRFPLPPDAPPAAIFAYADDLTLVLPDEHSLNRAMTVIHLYGQASGAKLNTAKSSVMYLRNPPLSPRHGLPVASEVKVLGYRFGPKGPSPSNWTAALTKLESRVRDYQQLNCPVTARATIARTLLLSVLSYVTSIMPIPAPTKQAVERVIFRFVWDGKPDKVKRDIVKLPKKRGGLGLTDLGILATALHVKWTNAALNSDMSLTRSLASFLLSTRLRLFTQSHLRNNVPRAGEPSPFYRGAAKALADIQEVLPQFDILGTPLKDLVAILTPTLPPHLACYSLKNQRPNWNLIHAEYLDASRATFQWLFARGNLPLRQRQFTRAGLTPRCLLCGETETTEHVFHSCLLPSALLKRIADLFEIPGIPYPTVRYLRYLPRQAVNQFVLTLVECSYQVWVARCIATYSDRRPGLHEVLARVRKELWFHLRREQRRLGNQQFVEQWCRPPKIVTEDRSHIKVSF